MQSTNCCSNRENHNWRIFTSEIAFIEFFLITIVSSQGSANSEPFVQVSAMILSGTLEPLTYKDFLELIHTSPIYSFSSTSMSGTISIRGLKLNFHVIERISLQLNSLGSACCGTRTTVGSFLSSDCEFLFTRDSSLPLLLRPLVQKKERST